METKLNLVINDFLAEQLLSDQENLEKLKSHCEGATTNLNLQEFEISDKAGRVVYTSKNA